jgi:putative transposase
MAVKAVENRRVSIAMACRTFEISETCYRYERLLSDENAEIADWLVRLTANRKTWGFGLCFLYLRNVKGFEWNHKRVYRIYCELELNLRIRPRKRLQRPKPDALAVPEALNQTWSMDFMQDQLADGRKFRTLNVLDDFNREGLGEPPPVCRRLQSKYGWSLWKKVTEQTGFRPRCAHARFG